MTASQAGRDELLRRRSARSLTGAFLVLVLCGWLASTPQPGISATPKPTAKLPYKLNTPSKAAWAATVAAACQEGTLTFYSSRGLSGTTINDAFHAAYPCLTLNTVFIAAPNTIIARLDAEHQQSLAGGDVYVLNVGAYSTLHAQQKDIVAAVDLPEAALWAKVAPKGLVDNGQGAFTVNSNLFVLAWNSNLVKKPIHSWADVIRPGISQVGTQDPATSPFQLAVYTWLTQHYGSDYVAKVGKEGAHIFQGTDPAAASLAAGETSVNFYISLPSILPLVKAGAPIGYYIPNPALTSPQYMAAVKWGKHPNAAKVFVNWMMSPAGQQAVIKANPGTLSSLGSKLVPGSSTLQVKTKTKAATKLFSLPQPTDPAVIAALTAKYTSQLHGGS